MVQTKQPRLPFVLKPSSSLQRPENSSWWTRANTVVEELVQELVQELEGWGGGACFGLRPSLMRSQIKLSLKMLMRTF